MNEQPKIRLPRGSDKCGLALAALAIYLVALLLTSPTRHGADRFYVLALNIIQNHSFDVSELAADGNHYATVSVDLLHFNGGLYCNFAPGQAFWGLPGLLTYRTTRQLGSIPHSLALTKEQTDKLDFYLGSYAMNATSNALITAVAFLAMAYLILRAFPRFRNLWLLGAFGVMYYLATPLLYYSAHLIQSQFKSALEFFVLIVLCLMTLPNSSCTYNRMAFCAGFVIGLALLTDTSSLLVLPFAVLHILLQGLGHLNFNSRKSLCRTLRHSLSLNLKRKLAGTCHLILGLLIPALFILYYQYTIFGNPFRSIHAFIFELPPHSPPTMLTYIKAYVTTVAESLFSVKVGLLTYTPLLLFPLIFAFVWPFCVRAQSAGGSSAESLRRTLFRTMLAYVSVCILGYNVTSAWALANQNWHLSGYNLYSARYLLPAVLPLGYLLFHSIAALRELTTKTKAALWAILAIMWGFSIAMNVSAALIGDWIFDIRQLLHFLHHAAYSLSHNLPLGRSLVDW